MITKDLQIFIKKNIIDKNINAKYLETGFLEGVSAFEMLSLGFKKVVSIEIDENFVNEGEKKFSTFIKPTIVEMRKTFLFPKYFCEKVPKIGPIIIATPANIPTFAFATPNSLPPIWSDRPALTLVTINVLNKVDKTVRAIKRDKEFGCKFTNKSIIVVPMRPNNTNTRRP